MKQILTIYLFILSAFLFSQNSQLVEIETNDGNIFALHKCGFTYSTLDRVFFEAGFEARVGGRRPDAFDLYLVAFKQRKPDEELKKIGGVKPPREFVLMDRAAVGLGSVFMHLKAEVNWYRIFNDLVGNFNEQELQKKQQAAIKKSGLTHKH